jgi:hypothetical protein
MTQPPENGFRLFKQGDHPLQILVFRDGFTAGEFEPDAELERQVKSSEIRLGFYDEDSNYIGPED